LKTHRASRKLEQAVITFISSQLTSIDETFELKKVFSDLDQNGDGKLSINELKQGYKMFGFESFDEVE
jgi:calcium-dependent protein kinase